MGQTASTLQEEFENQSKKIEKDFNKIKSDDIRFQMTEIEYANHLLGETVKAFNEIPNTKLKHNSFNQTYQLASAIDSYLKEVE